MYNQAWFDVFSSKITGFRPTTLPKVKSIKCFCKNFLQLHWQVACRIYIRSNCCFSEAARYSKLSKNYCKLLLNLCGTIVSSSYSLKDIGMIVRKTVWGRGGGADFLKKWEAKSGGGVEKTESGTMDISSCSFSYS